MSWMVIRKTPCGDRRVERVGDEHSEPAPEQKAHVGQNEPGNEDRSEQGDEGNGELRENDVAVADQDRDEGEKGSGGDHEEEHDLTASAHHTADQTQSVVLGGVLEYGVPNTGEVVAQPFPGFAAGVCDDDPVEPGALVDDDFGEGQADTGHRGGVELQHAARDGKEDDHLDHVPGVPAFAGKGDAESRPGNHDEGQTHPESVAGVEKGAAGGVHELARELVEDELELVGIIDGDWSDGEHGPNERFRKCQLPGSTGV